MKIFPLFLKITLGSVLSLTAVGKISAQSVEDLWITEVWPATGQIEVTNVSETTITTASALPFCHRFDYVTSVPANTTFTPGQSRLYTVSFGNQTASDLWIYSSRSFGSSTALLNGLTWGAAPIGRTGVAVNGQDWDSTTSFVASPAPNQSISLTGPDPRSAANWSVGSPNLGTFSLFTPEEERPTLRINREGNDFRLIWSEGQPPYQLMASSDLSIWQPVTQRTMETEALIPIEGNERRFFQVISNAAPEEMATYRVTFRSAWSGLAFNTVPPSPMLSPITGGTHSEEISFWESGSLASSGLETLTETGNAEGFISEINAAINTGTGGELIEAAGVTEELGVVTFEFTARSETPLLTLASRFSSSPDWFTGISGHQLMDENGNFISSFELELRPWDAGTEDGTLFSSDGADTSPPAPITSLVNSPVFGPSLLIGFNQPPVPVAALEIERIDVAQ